MIAWLPPPRERICVNLVMRDSTYLVCLLLDMVANILFLNKQIKVPLSLHWSLREWNWVSEFMPINSMAAYM